LTECHLILARAITYAPCPSGAIIKLIHLEGKDMKVRNLTKSVLVALMISSPMVGAETQYPAADFQPEIIKQDQEHKPCE